METLSFASSIQLLYILLQKAKERSRHTIACSGFTFNYSKRLMTHNIFLKVTLMWFYMTDYVCFQVFKS